MVDRTVIAHKGTIRGMVVLGHLSVDSTSPLQEKLKLSEPVASWDAHRVLCIIFCLSRLHAVFGSTLISDTPLQPLLFSVSSRQVAPFTPSASRMSLWSLQGEPKQQTLINRWRNKVVVAFVWRKVGDPWPSAVPLHNTRELIYKIMFLIVFFAIMYPWLCRRNFVNVWLCICMCGA